MKILFSTLLFLSSSQLFASSNNSEGNIRLTEGPTEAGFLPPGHACARAITGHERHERTQNGPSSRVAAALHQKSPSSSKDDSSGVR